MFDEGKTYEYIATLYQLRDNLFLSCTSFTSAEKGNIFTFLSLFVLVMSVDKITRKLWIDSHET